MKNQKNIYKNSAFDFLRGALLPLLFTGSVILLIMSGLSRAEASSSAEGLRILDESIRRAVVMNYAIEGRYPDSIEYVKSRYGIHVDETKYAVYYNIFATNIMPEIRVVEVS